jgi:hypothetical protein
MGGGCHESMTVPAGRLVKPLTGSYCALRSALVSWAVAYVQACSSSIGGGALRHAKHGRMGESCPTRPRTHHSPLQTPNRFPCNEVTRGRRKFQNGSRAEIPSVRASDTRPMQHALRVLLISRGWPGRNHHRASEARERQARTEESRERRGTNMKGAVRAGPSWRLARQRSTGSQAGDSSRTSTRASSASRRAGGPELGRRVRDRQTDQSGDLARSPEAAAGWRSSSSRTCEERSGQGTSSLAQSGAHVHCRLQLASSRCGGLASSARTAAGLVCSGLIPLAWRISSLFFFPFFSLIGRGGRDTAGGG